MRRPTWFLQFAPLRGCGRARTLSTSPNAALYELTNLCFGGHSLLWIRLLEPELGAGPARSCAISDLCPPLVALSDGRALLQLGAGLTRSCRPAHSRCARHAGAPRASRQFRPSPAAYVPGTLLQPQRFKRALSSRSTSAVPRSCFPFRYTLFSCLWLPSSSPWLSSFLAGSLRIQLPPPDPNSKPQPETPAKSIARLSNATTTLSAPVLLMLGAFERALPYDSGRPYRRSVQRTGLPSLGRPAFPWSHALTAHFAPSHAAPLLRQYAALSQSIIAREDRTEAAEPAPRSQSQAALALSVSLCFISTAPSLPGSSLAISSTRSIESGLVARKPRAHVCIHLGGRTRIKRSHCLRIPGTPEIFDLTRKVGSTLRPGGGRSPLVDAHRRRCQWLSRGARSTRARAMTG
ncbi:hypothetical protein B0H15DRAFT_868186 [Mycena belliarum]|uniref:Uncharacterized protein n=1 Tax=Mycena belliarum TaxID=1033014 RepID=A0AAD6TNN5_9AGAR|nr:hypothetical protein B0H15DRAFT_868186 [Mycena belliae]